MVLVNLLLNFSLLLSLLIAPCLVLMAYWYRKKSNQPIMIWKKPEMVVVTITFSITALILFIVGISCFFTKMGYVNSIQTQNIPAHHFEHIGFICMLLLGALALIYVAIRLLLIQVITQDGIIVNSRILRIPDYRNVIEWHEISDYYSVPDYPNVMFTLIIQKEALKYTRVTLCVPIYMRDDFESLLERKMFSASAIEARSQLSKHRYSKN